jgi:hypothetical protein
MDTLGRLERASRLGSLVPTVTTDSNQTFKALVSGYNDTALSPLNATAPIR